MKRLAIAVGALFVAATAGAQMYRWVDKDGKVYYTDTPPPGAATNVQKRGTAAAAAPADAGSGAPYAVQQAAKNFPVVVYTAPNCGQPCADGKALLAARGVPYREIAVGDGFNTDDLRKATGGDTVPVMMVGRSPTRGFETEMWQSALDAANYPRGAPPLSAAAQKAAQAPAAKADAPKPLPVEPAKPLGPYAPK